MVRQMMAILATMGEMANRVMISHLGFAIISRWLLDFLLVLAVLCYCSYLDARFFPIGAAAGNQRSMSSLLQCVHLNPSHRLHILENKLLCCVSISAWLTF